VDLVSGGEGALRLVFSRAPRQGDGRNRAASGSVPASDRSGESTALLVLHAHVAHHEVERAALQDRSCFSRGLRRRHPRAVRRENRTQGIPRFSIVVEHEDAHPAEQIAGRARDLGIARQRGCRERHGERRSPPCAVARDTDLTAVQLDEMPHDGEPEPHAAGAARRDVLRLAEAGENVREELGRDAATGVAHAQHELLLATFESHLDAPARRRELDGVRQQVPHHLLEPIGIAGHGTRGLVELELEPHSLGVGRRTDDLEDGADDRREIDASQVEPHLAADDARDVEEILDQLRLRAPAALDRLDRAIAALSERKTLEHTRPSEHGGERRPQLVRHHREKLVLGAIRGLGLVLSASRGGIEARVVERDRRLRRQADDDALGGLGEDAALRMTEEQAAEDLAAPAHDGGGEVARDRQVAGGHAVMRRALAVSRVLLDVVDAHHALARERRTEERVLRGIPNFSKASRGAPESV
jgi:hypothetical protein